MRELEIWFSWVQELEIWFSRVQEDDGGNPPYI